MEISLASRRFAKPAWAGALAGESIRFAALQQIHHNQNHGTLGDAGAGELVIAAQQIQGAEGMRSLPRSYSPAAALPDQHRRASAAKGGQECRL
ncbi:hypothetical protein [Variovorax sp. HJSM1_2]|uniref:hypothetical protein n=1 Tax=Variovorax sp. HJSM1_2 TaxID=3366263 RepID=UPI003BDFF1F3